MGYSIWHKEPKVGSAAVLDKYPDGLKVFMPRIGKQLGQTDYPEILDFSVSPDIGGIVLADLLRNTLGYYVASPPLRTLLEQHSDAEIEFLEIRVVGRTGRPEETPYYIANLIGRQLDCADLSRSEMTELKRKKGRYGSIKRLYLHEEKIDPEFKIFRLQQAPHVYIVRDDLRREIEDSGLTGSAFFAMGDDVDID